MLSVRMQRCSRQEWKYPSQMNRTRTGRVCKGEYFIYMDNMDTLRNVYNFRCMIQGREEKAKSFGEVK